MKNKFITLFLAIPIILVPCVALSSCNETDDREKILPPENLSIRVENLNTLIVEGSPSDNIDGYYIDLSYDEYFNNYVGGYKNYDVGNETKYQITNLAKGTRYFARLRSYKGERVSENSNVINCYTYIDRPQILSEIVNSKTSFSLKWAPIAHAEGYYLDVSNDSSFATFVPGYSNLKLENTKQELDVMNLSPDTEYYFRLRASIGDFITENSDVKSIKTLSENPILPQLGEYNFGEVITSKIENWTESMYLVCSNNSCNAKCDSSGNFIFTNGCVTHNNDSVVEEVTISIYDKFNNLLSTTSATCRQTHIVFRPIEKEYEQSSGSLKVMYELKTDASLTNNFNCELHLGSSCLAMGQGGPIDNKQDAFLIRSDEINKEYTGYGPFTQSEPVKYKLETSELKIGNLENILVSTFHVEDIEI